MGLMNRTPVALALLLLSGQALAARPLLPSLSFASGQTKAVTSPRPSSLAQSNEAPPMLRVATVVERIERDLRDIRVYEASRPIELPWYSEMAIAVPRDPHASLESLQGSSVGLVRNDKSTNEWTLYSNVVGMGGGTEGRTALTLADNVFKVRKVIPCTSRHAIVLRMGGWVYHVKPGQVLLVLG